MFDIHCDDDVDINFLPRLLMISLQIYIQNYSTMQINENVRYGYIYSFVISTSFYDVQSIVELSFEITEFVRFFFTNTTALGPVVFSVVDTVPSPSVSISCNICRYCSFEYFRFTFEGNDDRRIRSLE